MIALKGHIHDKRDSKIHGNGTSHEEVMDGEGKEYSS